jgi:hypothetical protein
LVILTISHEKVFCKKKLPLLASPHSGTPKKRGLLVQA